MTALALNCTISEFTRFDRKNYPYPDLMKGYQISQYDNPIGEHGWMEIEADGARKKVNITRVHLEEDVAKLLHRTKPNEESYSLVDVNRAGVPLMEIVGEPELRSPEEAREYLMELHTILRYLGVSTANMEEGSFRCDANISIRPRDSDRTLSKVEIKNMNSFKAVYLALGYEAERQRKVARDSGRLIQETRGWVEERGVTVSQRSKEYAHDYRYFPEPDLPPLMLSREWVEDIRARLPELPRERCARFMAQYGLPPYDARLLTQSKDLADYFEACLQLGGDNQRAKKVSNWLLGEFSRLLNATGTDVENSRLTPRHLTEMLDLIESGSLSGTSAKAIFEEMFRTGRHAAELLKERGLVQITDLSEIERIVKQVIEKENKAVKDYLAGKEQALKFLVGQVMRASRGRADAKLVSDIIRRELAEGGNAALS
jgi:aspartyl-tRNA(Asn)/glutamyl-tRNA(Gln) amidotransferase subunit B